MTHFSAILRILFVVLMGALPLSSQASASDRAPQDNFIRFALDYEHSNNIYKSNHNAEKNQRLKGEVELNYKRKRQSNKLSLSYLAQYKDESHSRLENSNFWQGKGAFTQNIFNKNFVFAISHQRQRFIIDQQQSDLDNNKTERDLFVIEQYWHIPYSNRNRVSLHVQHSNARFKDYKAKDSAQNSADVSWLHKLNKKSQLQFTYRYSENEFNEPSQRYYEQNFAAQYSGIYQFGEYLFGIGKSYVKKEQIKMEGLNYHFRINARIKAHLFSIEAQRALSNSSFRGDNNYELDFQENQLLWSTESAFLYEYAMLNERLLSNNRLYQNIDETMAEYNQKQSTKEKGIESQLSWQLNKQWRLLVSADYSHATLYNSMHKKRFESLIAGRFNLSSALYIELSASYENEKTKENNKNYNETHYNTRIAYTY
ncbi:hypothetical protein PCNPT3_01310 [Psychromonas sp. CNPT3]|uniref:hypothetical protein n=1 Tax=Psychromonas sp. CNPT3 TaxID=314282 RepID=UPI00006E9CB8|nr:hypothetical protein [Psychromonas sp. CNPT3]AGH80204.1 hypothetical protein PCNPT3_01310 [Psychromonas sp. CNPT3]